MEVLAQTTRPFMNMTLAQIGVVIAMAAFLFVAFRWRSNQIKKAEEKRAEALRERNRAASAGGAGAGGDERRAPSVRRQTSALTMSDVSVQVRSVLAEIEETSRRVSAQIQNRTQKLEILLEEADAKIKRLEALQAGGGSGSVGKTGAGPIQSNGGGGGAFVTMRDDGDAQHRAIYELADRGKSAREIAQAMSKQPGEIELILALRNGGR